MRTKTLLLTAALSAAGLATSMAQVYSVNAVGYVNVTVPGGNKLAILAVPLNGTNNSVNTNIRLPDPGSADCLIFRWNADAQTFLNPLTWYDGFGWYLDGEPDPVINPGNAFWFQNVTGSPISFTMVGEVPMGANIPNPVKGGNLLDLKSSVVPKAAGLGDLGFPGTADDLVFIWDAAIQNFENPWTYYEGYGWYRNEDPSSPAGPVIQPATGFWVQKTGPSTTWTQSFSVN